MARVGLGGLEDRLNGVLGPVGRFTAPRWPIFAVAAFYLAILVVAPSQIASVVDANWTDGRWTDWLAFIAPVILAGVGHLALLSGQVVILRTWDSVIANVPLAALTLMVGRWAPGALLLMIPALLVGLAVCYGLAPLIVRHGRAWRVGAILSAALVYLACVVALQLVPQEFPRAFGPLGVLSLGVAILGLLAAIAAMRPVLSTLYLVVCVLAAMTWRDSRPVELYDTSHYVNGYGLYDGLDTWLRSRGDLDDYRRAGRPYPVIIASAEGGGIYAAAHAYSALTAMSEVCPSFGQHLFATVGVSGGSIGTLLYAAKSQTKVPNKALQPCHHRTAAIDTRPLTVDLLSPALANLLFLRTADFLIPGPNLFQDGGKTLTDSIAAMDPGNPAMLAPLRKSWNPRGASPMTIFVSTDVLSGNRFVFSPAGDSGARNAESFPGGNIVSPSDIPANTAAFISARFPWLTPTARLQVSDKSFRVLGDGGYFENSGADTAMDLIQQIRDIPRANARCKEWQSSDPAQQHLCACPLVVVSSFTEPVTWSGCAIPIFIAYMPIAEVREGLPGYVYEDTPHPPQSYLLDPLSTMLQARGARGDLALDRARSAFAGGEDPTLAQGTGVDVGYFPHELAVAELGLPLGWKLSRKSATDIVAYAAPTTVCAQDGEPEPTPTPALVSSSASKSDKRAGEEEGLAQAVGHENGCNMRMLAWLFKRPDGPAGIAIQGFGGG